MTFWRRYSFLTTFALLALLVGVVGRLNAADPAFGGGQTYSSFDQTGAGTRVTATVTPTRASLTISNLVVWTCNLGTVWVHVAIGGGSVAATTGSTSVPPSACTAIYGKGASNVSTVSESSSAVVVFTPGTGHP